MKLILCLSLCTYSVLASSQITNKSNPAAPCCTVAYIGPIDGISALNGPGLADAMVMVRNNINGRTVFFNAAGDKKNIRIGDPVTTDAGTHIITSVNRVITHYSVTDPARINTNVKGAVKQKDPCCRITKLEARTTEPCCGIITINNNTSGQTYSFKIDESYLGETEKNLSVMNQLKTGQAVAMTADGEFVLIKTSINGQPIYYSYTANK